LVFVLPALFCDLAAYQGEEKGRERGGGGKERGTVVILRLQVLILPAVVGEGEKGD